MEVHVEKGVRTALIVTLIAENDVDRRALDLLNSDLRAGQDLEIHHHVESLGGVNRMTLVSHRRD